MWPKKFKMHSPKQHSNLDYKLKPGQLVKCHLCSFVSSDSVVLNNHFSTHTENKFFSCGICKKRFSQKIHLKAHQRTHSSEKPYICPICHKEFSDACYSHNQRQFNAKVKPFACSFCGKFFAQNCDKLKHELTHRHQSKENSHSEQNEPNSEKSELNSEQIELNEPKFHKCSQCIQSFPEQSQLKMHMVRIHANDPSDKCPVCTKGFTTPRALKIHVKKIHPETVSSDRNNKCHICSYSSIHLTTFRRHLLTHTGEKPHTCHICQKKFTQKVNLTTHLRIHYLDKPFVCPICDKAFTQSSHLQKHHKSVHSNSRRALFSVKKTFSYNRLKLKIRSTAKKRHKCPHCNQRFIRVSELKVHKQKKHVKQEYMKVQMHENAEQSTDAHQKSKRTSDSDTNTQKTYNKKMSEEKQNKSAGTYQKSKKTTNESDTNTNKSSNKLTEEEVFEDNSDTKQRKRKNPERSAVIDKINKKQSAINKVQQIQDIRAEIEAITQIGYKKESDPVSKTVSQQILEINAEIAAITQSKLIKKTESNANLQKKQVKITNKNGKVKEKQKKHLGKNGAHEKSKKLPKIPKSSTDTKKTNKQPVSNVGLKRRCKKPPERNDVILKKYKELFGNEGATQHSHRNYLDIGINSKQKSKSIVDIEKQQSKQVIVIADIHHIESDPTSQKHKTDALNLDDNLTIANTDITAVETLNNEATLKASYVELHESITHHKDTDTHQSESILNIQQSESFSGIQHSESDTGTQQSESHTDTQQSESHTDTQQSESHTGNQQSESHSGNQQSESHTGNQQSESNVGTRLSKSDTGTQQSEKNISPQQSVNFENSDVCSAKSIADTCLLENNGHLKICERNVDSADPECGRNGKTQQGQRKHQGNDTESQVRCTRNY